MESSYSIPDNTRIYAIGDIHGYVKELEAMHALIRQDIDDNPIDDPQIVYIGDYIDRGPENDAVIQCLLERELNEPDITHVFLRGNHENAMMEFIEKPSGPRKDWLDWGGINTLINYGVQPDMTKPLSTQATVLAAGLAEKLPMSHAEFLRNSQLYYECGEFLFVHAGIKPGVPLDKQKDHDLMMIRKGFLDYEEPHEKCVVHGHTSVKEIDIKPNRINVDTGLYHGRHLVAAVLESNTIRSLKVDMIKR